MPRRLTFTRTMHTLPIAAALVVSLNPLGAQCVMPAQDAGAMVLLQSGDVSQLGDRAGYRVTIKLCGVVPQQHVIKTGPDGYAKFQVSDGSTFEVFPNSEVTFRKTYGIGDLLNVWMGKVKVYIQHFPGVPNPNNVTTPTALISVRGTIFDVDVQDLDGTTFVTLDEGIVDVRHLRVASGIVRLNPGESIQVLPNLPLMPLAHDRGLILRQVLRGLEDAVRVVYQRTGGPSPGPGGTTNGPVGSTGGAQGDGKGKNTGTTTGTGTGNGPPTGAPTGAPPNPPPPPPGGGGGE